MVIRVIALVCVIFGIGLAIFSAQSAEYAEVGIYGGTAMVIGAAVFGGTFALMPKKPERPVPNPFAED